MTRDQTLMACDETLMTREQTLMACDETLMTHDQTLMTRDETLITQLAFHVVHELMILSDYAPALSAHKESPSGFAYFCPRNRKGVSADINRPKSVVRKLRNEVINKCSNARPDLFGGFAPGPPLPFLPLMEEKEAKEDQGDDRHPSFHIEERRPLIHDLE